MLPDFCEFLPVDHGPHDIGGQHRHEVRGIGLDLGHSSRQKKWKGHESRAARQNIYEACEKAPGE
jgi:hypothetical protein